MERLRQLRLEKGMSQVRLSMEMNISQVTISEYENGRNYPSVNVLIKFAQFFGVSTDYLLGLTDIRGIISSGVDSAEESELVGRYRSLAPSERAQVRAYIQALCDRKNNKSRF